MARVIYRKKTTLVEPDVEETHATALDYIWTNSRLQIETAPDGSTLKWRQLGFASENLSHEFTEAGVLGLDCLVSSALWRKGASLTHRKRKTLCKVTQIIFQRLCKSKILGRHSGDVLSHVHRTRLSSSYRNIGVSWLPDACFSLQYDLRRILTSQCRDLADATSPVFQPFFLNFYKVHALATNFSLQMWNESGAAMGDFTRVVALVRSQCVIPKATRKTPINACPYSE